MRELARERKGDGYGIFMLDGTVELCSEGIAAILSLPAIFLNTMDKLASRKWGADCVRAGFSAWAFHTAELLLVRASCVEAEQKQQKVIKTPLASTFSCCWRMPSMLDVILSRDKLTANIWNKTIAHRGNGLSRREDAAIGRPGRYEPQLDSGLTPVVEYKRVQISDLISPHHGRFQSHVEALKLFWVICSIC